MTSNFKRILCPVDLSSSSRNALKLAAEMGKSSKATLFLLQVVGDPSDKNSPLAIYAPAHARRKLSQSDSWQHEAGIQKSQDLLKQFCRDSVKALPKTNYLIEVGDPLEKIIDVAYGKEIDLIVLATRGRTGIKRLVIGSVAEKVVRQAPCPVLTVNARAGKRKSRDVSRHK